jgi:hypothetical protein
VLHWMRLMSLRHFPGAVSRRGHNQLSALKPLFGVAWLLWWNKEVDARQHLHGLPPDDRLVCLRPEPYSRVIAAISWHEPPGGPRAVTAPDPELLVALRLE